MAPPDDVLDIPGNEYVLGRLRELLATEQAVAFVGAGASAGLYPLWDGLIRQLADEAVKRGLASDADRATWLRIAPHSPQQAVRGIKDRLGRSVYGAVLAGIFGYRTGEDGKPFTSIQRLLLELPFRGYVTTNYDPGLLEARAAVRPGVRATGYATWQDADAVRRWQTGEVFGEPQAYPVLYAHGIFEKSDTIVLGAGEYREAYRPGAFRELVGNLWSQGHLVFVGFSFSDAWFNVVAEQVLGLTARQAAGEPRHIAVLGLSADEEYSLELRGVFRDAYDSEVLLYPVQVIERDGIGHQDHGRLLTVLEKLPRPLADRPAGRSPPPTEQAVAPQAPEPPRRWVHETTEDERYTEPADALARLDRWVADLRVRAIAITGIGGLGKTALVGHWLKDRHGAAGRPTKGLFGWSFNADRQVDNLLAALLDFAVKDLGLPPAKRGTRPVDAAVAVLRAVPLVVVLDGLEILQEPPGELASEGPGRLGYGELLDDDLRAFLDAACRLPHPGLVVLTSRFPFADLTGFLGSSLRLLPLERLSATEGAELLGRLDVKGNDQDRREVSRRLDGHPLALRVFAATLARQAYGDPTRLLEVAFDREDLRDDDPSEAKLRQLLGFYQTRLPDAWQALLGAVALFPDQVDVATALSLARQLPGVADRLQGVTDAQLRGTLNTLVADGLLTREHDQAGQERYACHPVIRAHFRAALLTGGPAVAAAAAGLLTGAISGHVQTIEQLGVVTNAIALLLDAGEVIQADALYREQLDGGWVFKDLPAPREGVRCALGFVADQHRREQVREQLSVRRLAFYLNEVGLNARNAAEFELAERYQYEIAELFREVDDEPNLSAALRNRAELLIDLGRLANAEAAAREALDLARRVEQDLDEQLSLLRLGTALSLQGQMTEAVASFDNANDLQRQIDPEHPALYSLQGVQWAELLMRLGRSAEARTVTEANLTICEHYNWQDDVARCAWLLGRLDTLASAYGTAATHLTRAMAILRGAHLLPELSRVLLAQADLDCGRHALDDADRHVQEALAIVSSRQLTLDFADALVLRGRIYLDRGRVAQVNASDAPRRWAEQALDHADDARILAQRCGYTWAERDAALLRADAYTMLGDAERAREARGQAEQFNRRIRVAT